ncbi:MAG: endonuclease III [Cytophagales bacterium]|nr:endonuclease III [Cytophagales bacterium]
MTKKERYEAVIAYFLENNPEAETELHYESPFELLVAVVLSAQCTDKRVNMVMPELMADFPMAERMMHSNFDELFPYIKSISYPNNKTKHLLGLSKMLVEDFNNKIPEDREELVKLPGVGRKTANVISSVLFNQPNMAVDTHVFRVSKRLGLVTQNSKTPLEVEKQLIKYIPEAHVHVAHHWLILHGRYTCMARKPKCADCEISHLCRWWEKNGNT